MRNAVFAIFISAGILAGADGPVFQFSCNEGDGGRLADASGSGYHAAGTAAWTKLKNGSAIVFTGEPGQGFSLKLPADKQIGKGSFTVSCWLNPSTVSIEAKEKRRQLFVLDGHYPAHIVTMELVNNDGTIMLMMGYKKEDGKHSYVQINSKKKLPVNAWTHVAALCDREHYKFRIYINGQLDNESNIDKTFDGDFSGEKPLTIGASWQQYQGAVDELSFHKRVLSADEIAAVYTGTKGDYENAVIAVAAGAMKPSARYFVSPDGDDAWSGTLLSANKEKSDGPFKTIVRARDTIRALKAKGLITGSVTVEIASGIYELAEPLTFTAADSGSAGMPVIYAAKKGSDTRIIGGSVVRGFKPAEGAALEKLNPAARGNVVVSDLKGQGIVKYGALKNGQSWANSETGMELFFNGKRMTLARYPNEGWMRIAGIVVDDGHAIHGQKGSKVGQFTVKDDRITNWVNEPSVMAAGYWFWDWADQRFMISNIDADRHMITLSNAKHDYGFRKNQWFYVYNILPELDAPGEWYVDRTEGILYFWPPANIDGGKTMVSLNERLFDIDGASNLEFRFLTFECAQGTGIRGKKIADVRFAGCTMRNVGGYGMSADGSNISVIGCDIYDTGDGGVSLTGGERKTLTPANNIVENCHIHHYGRWDPMYKGGIHLNGVGNIARRNLIHEGPHTAIFWGGNDIVMELNEIHSVVYESGDAGAIYAGRDWTMRGCMVRNNYFHHIYGFEGRGANGVYFDDQYSSADTIGNIIYKVARGMLMGGGRDNRVIGNMFIDCPVGFSLDARGLGWAASGKDGLIQKLQAMPYDKPPWSERFPQLLTLLDDDPMAPKNDLFERNISWKCGTWDKIEGKALPGAILTNNMIDVDPKFVDEKNGNFDLKPDSPAWAIGFERIPVEKIGVYNDEWRATWPVKNTVRAGKSLIGQADPHPGKPEAVPSVTRAPDIDGVIGGEWDAMKKIALAETPNRDSVKSPATGYLGYADKTLYVAVFVPIKDAAKLKLESKWGQNDGIEVCFRLHEGIDYRPGPTFIVQGFANGDKAANALTKSADDAAKKILAASRVAAKAVDGGWSIEMAIPLDEAGIVAGPGMKIGFNIGVRRMESNEWIAWAGTKEANFQLGNSRIIILE